MHEGTAEYPLLVLVEWAPETSRLSSRALCVCDVDNARDLLVNLCLCNSIESENNEGSALSVIATTDVVVAAATFQNKKQGKSCLCVHKHYTTAT